MPLQNRVLPTGEIVAIPDRGTMLGNRGVLHDEHRILTPRRWAHRNWVCCVLAFKGRRRKLMTQRRYTELFFLDEAVALAAGHRPCAECRRADYLQWKAIWEDLYGPASAPKMDSVLHAARAVPGARKLRRSQVRSVSFLPDGAFVMHDGTPHLRLGDALMPFTPGGYDAPVPLPDGPAEVLTPTPTIEVMLGGYRPALHPSARV
ncbi:hypothetical protein [Jannaschia aquimarina]|uniref:Ada DNA repair metal-binding domain-containing protein n=1 Tax=Jannaschia aquimarina TaxID=935700 RepID=A0A0D1CT41_9RHOB|nr:hypothetical protein [Jannaschia aquimarina]KIT17932.1 hypothetical protein jaqu_02880 [Jannaschia aquimarina]SNT08662.1 hypothetical protein SAMN05421775_105185 [Jannaschia aquimarina]